MLKLPKEAAVVLYEQLGYEDIVDKCFESKPVSKDEIYNNKNFIAELEKKMSENFPQNGSYLIQKMAIEKDVDSILDIGCGLALTDLCLYTVMKKKPQLYLLDGSFQSNDNFVHVASGAYEENYQMTFNIKATRDFLIMNGVNQDHINFIAPSSKSLNHLRDINLVISITSWGWHYPFDVYWEGVKSCIADNGKIFLDLRKKFIDISILKKSFKEVEIEEKRTDWLRVTCHKPIR